MNDYLYPTDTKLNKPSINVDETFETIRISFVEIDKQLKSLEERIKKLEDFLK